LNRPFVWISLAYIAGIITARFLDISSFSTWSGVIVFLFLAVVCLILRWRRPLTDSSSNTSNLSSNIFSLIPILLTIFCLGILTYQFHSYVRPDNIANFLKEDKTEAILRGVVVKPVDRHKDSYNRLRTTLTLKLKRTRFGGEENYCWRNVSGNVLVYVYGANEIKYGDDLLVKAKVSSLQGPGNPGQFDYKIYLERRGISATASVSDMRDVVLVPSRAWDNILGPVLSWIYDLRDRCERIIDESLGGTEAELLKAMLLGMRQGIDDEIKDTFIRTGTVHILAISGLHTGLVVFCILVFLKFLRIPRKARYGLAIILLIVFCFLTGLKPPVVRATLMAVLIMGAVLLDRETDIYNILGLAAFIMLVINPGFLFDAGFQLSFMAVISISCFYPVIEYLLFGRILKNIDDKINYNQKLDSHKFNITGIIKYRFLSTSLLILRYLIKLFCASLAAWIGTMPVVWYYFNVISPIAVFVNILVVPLLFVTVACGLCMILTGLVWIKGAVFLWSGVCWFWLNLLVNINSVFSQLSFGYFYLPAPGLFFIILYYVLIVLVIKGILIWRRQQDTVGDRAKVFWYSVAVLVAVNLIVWPVIFESSDGAGPSKMKVTFLDVGHGDSAFIEFPHGGNMLIDTGVASMGRWVVKPFLLHNGIRRLDALVLTHCDSDHIGGAEILVDNFKFDIFFDNGTADRISGQASYPDKTGYGDYLQTIKNYRKASGGNNVSTLNENMAVWVNPGPVKIEVLHPEQDMKNSYFTDDNNNSVLLKISYGRVSFMFCGDIEEQAMTGLLGLGEKLRSNVLKVAHHGGGTGVGGRVFMELVNPEIAIISEALHNRFNLPNKNTVKTLHDSGSRVLQTGKYGAITVSTDGYYLYTDTFR